MQYSIAGGPEAHIPIRAGVVGNRAVMREVCQEGDEKFSFRSDVTNIISGNGSYAISGLPVDTTGFGADTDGAILFIIYRDSTASFKGTLIMNDGAVAVGNATVERSIKGLSFTANTNGKAFMLLSDMENKPGNAIKIYMA